MLLATNSYAQNKNKKLFLRVYTIQDEKIKGNIQNFNDSLLVLQRGEKEFRIESKNIRIIKTKRAGFANIVAGAGIGALIGGLIGASQKTDENAFIEDTKEWNIFTYGVTGFAIGGSIGAVTMFSKKSKKYIINGELEKWQLFVKTENLKN